MNEIWFGLKIISLCNKRVSVKLLIYIVQCTSQNKNNNRHNISFRNCNDRFAIIIKLIRNVQNSL